MQLLLQFNSSSAISRTLMSTRVFKRQNQNQNERSIKKCIYEQTATWIGEWKRAIALLASCHSEDSPILFRARKKSKLRLKGQTKFAVIWFRELSGIITQIGQQRLGNTDLKQDTYLLETKKSSWKSSQKWWAPGQPNCRLQRNLAIKLTENFTQSSCPPSGRPKALLHLH